MLKKIKRKNLENLILNVIIIVISIVTIILMSDNYKQIFISENNINSIDKFNKISKDKTYVSMDLTNATLTRFSLENKKTEKVDVNTYVVEYDNEIIVLFLKPNTALTNKVKGKLFVPIEEELEVLEELKVENKNKNVKEISFTNVNYTSYESFYRYFFLVLILLVLFSAIFSVFDIIYYIHPDKSHSYKKYLKKQ